MSSTYFVHSSTHWKDINNQNLPEFAFAGRSNVGKSSLIGTLLKQEKLIRTSRTPGRTQLLNVFVFENRYTIIDLPGYGYAKLSKEKRKDLQYMIRGYLEKRPFITGVVLVIDMRRDPVSEYDKYMVNSILECQRPLLVALTKVDLISKTKRRNRSLSIEKQLNISFNSSVLCSSKSGEGRKEILTRMQELTTGLVL